MEFHSKRQLSKEDIYFQVCIIIILQLPLRRRVCVCVCVSRSVVSDSLRPHGLQPTRLLCPWNSSSKNTGVSCHSLLQVPNPGIEPRSLTSRQILYCLSYWGSPSRQKGNLQISVFDYVPILMIFF